MKPGTLVPIRGVFEDPRALLHDVAADPEIEGVVVVTFRKDGEVGRAQIDVTRANMAYASLVLADWAREDV